MKKDWIKLRKIRGGHSYWRRIKDGAIGIADDSGTHPDDCEPADDPPLLLDARRPIVISTTHGCFVPIKHDNGRTSSTPVGGFEALWVATQFLMAIEAVETNGATIRVRTASVEVLEAA